MKHTSRGIDYPLINPMKSPLRCKKGRMRGPFNDSDPNSQDLELGQDTTNEGLDKDEDACKPPSPQAFILENCNNLIFWF